VSRKLSTILGLALVLGGVAHVAGVASARATGARGHGRVVALVGGVPIYDVDVTACARDLATPLRFGSEEVAPALAPAEAAPSESERARALERIIDEEAVVQEALRRGYDRTDPHVARRLIQRILEEASACSSDETPGCCTSAGPDRSSVFAPCARKARSEVGVHVEPDALARIEASTRSG